jgi:hypothetical protein
MKARRRIGNISPFILNFGNNWRRLVNFSCRLLYSQNPLNRRLIETESVVEPPSQLGIKPRIIQLVV